MVRDSCNKKAVIKIKQPPHTHTKKTQIKIINNDDDDDSCCDKVRKRDNSF